jgi:hypothetical protein
MRWSPLTTHRDFGMALYSRNSTAYAALEFILLAGHDAKTAKPPQVNKSHLEGDKAVWTNMPES